ncbi:hypothetical protein RBB50_008892 [Rhinocladiella similis]
MSTTHLVSTDDTPFENGREVAANQPEVPPSSPSSATVLDSRQLSRSSQPDTSVDRSETDDSDKTSSSGSSEDEPSSEEDGDDEEDEEDLEATALPEPHVPVTTGDDLRSRLQSFLPQIQNANLALQNAADVLERRIDNVSDSDEHYIEMNLGLGVLSERREASIAVTGVDDGSATSDSDEQNDDAAEDDDKGHNGHNDDNAVHGGVLAALKGEKNIRGTKRKVEELG